MMEIALRNGLVALLDDIDFDSLSNRHWRDVPTQTNVYAATDMYVDGKNRPVMMHRLILSPKIGEVVDHINGNGLDNRRENIRVCSRAENGRNWQTVHGVSKYRGVYKCKKTGRWIARLKKRPSDIWLGRHSTEEDAALAYNHAAVDYFGEFAHLNVIAIGVKE